MCSLGRENYNNDNNKMFIEETATIIIISTKYNNTSGKPYSQSYEGTNTNWNHARAWIIQARRDGRHRAERLKKHLAIMKMIVIQPQVLKIAHKCIQQQQPRKLTIHTKNNKSENEQRKN